MWRNKHFSCTKVSHCICDFWHTFWVWFIASNNVRILRCTTFFAFVCRNFWAKCKTTLRMSPSEVYPTRKTFPIWEEKLTSLQKHKRVKRIILQKPKEKPSIGKKASLSHQFLIHKRFHSWGQVFELPNKFCSSVLRIFNAHKLSKT